MIVHPKRVRAGGPVHIHVLMNAFLCFCFFISTDQISEDGWLWMETNLLCEVDVIPVVFVKLVPVCQQSIDIVSCVTVSLEESVWDPRLFFLQL